MKKILVAVLALVLVMTACAASAEGAIKIGVIGPMTGAAADYGMSVANGAQIAADEINADGQKVELFLLDDEHDPEKSINAYNQAMDSGAQMIVGCVTTAPCVAVAAQAYEERVFMLTPSASSPDVTADNDNVFQLCFIDPAQGVSGAEYFAAHDMKDKVAVIYNNADAYSTGIYQNFEAKAKELGINIVSVTTFTDDTTDFSVQVTSAKEAGAEYIFLPIYYTPASMIFQQAKSMEYAPVFVGVDGMDGILSIEGFDTSLAEGVVLLTPFSAVAETSKAFVTEYQTRHGSVPSQFAADGYDCVYAVMAACEAAGITPDTPAEEACDKLIEAFKTLEFTGLTGAMTWSESGEVNKTPTAVVIKNGAYEAVE